MTGTTDVVAEYRYNGLNQRITAHYDTDIDGDVDGSDVVSHFVYDQRWRTVARYEDANTDPAEQWVHHHAGLAVSGSGSYIDSVILRDRDTTGNGTMDERLYYLQNWRSDVVALITDTGDQREQVRYEPYGTPFGLPAGDLDSDGDLDATDYAGITGSYDVRKDVNMDGSITFADTTAAYNINGLQTLGRGVASSDAVLNRKGYAGYEHLSELAGAKWDVRNRVLLSELGTWNRRDPLGYVDGMNLYAHVMLMPILSTDPLGLICGDLQEWELPTQIPESERPSNWTEKWECCYDYGILKSRSSRLTGECKERYFHAVRECCSPLQKPRQGQSSGNLFSSLDCIDRAWLEAVQCMNPTPSLPTTRPPREPSPIDLWEPFTREPDSTVNPRYPADPGTQAPPIPCDEMCERYAEHMKQTRCKLLGKLSAECELAVNTASGHCQSCCAAGPSTLRDHTRRCLQIMIDALLPFGGIAASGPNGGLPTVRQLSQN